MATSEDQHTETATMDRPSESQLQPTPAPIPTPILTLPNCLVRAYHPQDAEQMVLAASSPLIAKNMRNTFPNPYTLDSANSWINLATSTPRRHNFGILSPEGQTFLGGVGLRPLTDIECRTYEVGYWIAPSAWGRGLATEVLKAFSRWAFETFEDMVRLEAGVFATNPASARVLSKAGFVHEGTRRKAIWKNGEVLDIWIYGLLREECLGE